MESEDKSTPPPRERRKEPRHPVDGTAILTLLDTSIHLRGRILDLSMSGCQFRTDDCFPMGVHRRAEIEFQLDGLPFRLAGVTQSIHKANRVGVRFVEMTERKRLQLEELIAEIKEFGLRPLSERGLRKTPGKD